MNANHTYFLAVANELNISKAAKKLYISPQCLSNHIKRLEASCHAMLFNRKPFLSLTPEGEAMVRALQQITIIENSLQSELQGIKDGTKGVLRVGIHSTRARYLLPLLFCRFHEIYPNVKVATYSAVTKEMAAMILRGTIDMYIGISRVTDPEIETVSLFEEKMFLVISDNVLKKFFPADYPECKNTFKQGINLMDFSTVPLILNNETSSIYGNLMDFTDSNGISLNVILHVNDSSIHYILCARDYGAFLCPETILTSQSMINKELYGSLNVFPIQDYDKINRIVLGYHKQSYLPRYAITFIDIAKNLMCELKYSQELGNTSPSSHVQPEETLRIS